MQTADIYVKVVVNVNEDDEADEEEIANFTTLVQQLIEFIQSIVEKNRFRNTVKAVLTDIVYIAIVFMQIPEETLQFWTDDTDTYCDDYNFDNCDSTVRTTSNDILLNLSEEFSPKHLLPALSNAIERHINVAQAEKSAQNQNWWKIIESAVTAMGTLKQFVCDKLDESKFNLKQFLAFVKTQLGGGADGSGYQQDVSPFLHNKCLWVLARYSNASADVYDRQTLQAILDCITNNMQAEKALQLQVGALLAMCEVCQELKPASPEQRAMVVDKFPAFMNFIPVIAPNAKNNILTDLLMTIALVISVSGKGEVVQVIGTSHHNFYFIFLLQFEESFTAAHHSKIIPFTIAIFIKNYEDPFILQQLQEILQVLATNPASIGPLQEKLVPTLVSQKRACNATFPPLRLALNTIFTNISPSR